MKSVLFSIFVASSIFIGFIIFSKKKTLNDNQTTLLGHCKDKAYFESWLSGRKLSVYVDVLKNHGIENLIGLASLEAFGDMDSEKSMMIMFESKRLRNILILQKFLMNHQRLDLISSMDLDSLEDLKEYSKLDLSPNDEKLQRELRNVESFENYKYNLWITILRENQTITWIDLILCVLVSLISIKLTHLCVRRTKLPIHYIIKHGGAHGTKDAIIHYLTGRYLAPHKCQVQFEWPDPYHVGETVGFTIKFYQLCGRPYPISEHDKLFIEIVQDNYKVMPSVTLAGIDPSVSNSAKVTFTIRKAGCYKINIIVQQCHILGSPFSKCFLPGSPCKMKSGIVQPISTVLAVLHSPFQQVIELRDNYNNLCNIPPGSQDPFGCCVHVTECDSGNIVSPVIKFLMDSSQSKIILVMKFEFIGCYTVSISSDGVVIKNGKFDVIVLNEVEKSLVQKIVANKSQNKYFEARLIGQDNETLSKSKKVSIHLSPRQLTIKENFLKIIPISKRLFTFRLCPSTKFQFLEEDHGSGQSRFTIEDGCQPTIHLISKDRNVIAATFTQFLLKNIGGSETFKDKQDYFYHEVRRLHQKRFHDKLSLTVDRKNIVISSMKATKAFNVSDWCKNFEITFVEEEGIDWGGLRREWFGLLCSNLFGTEFGLFKRLTDSSQGLVHPNPDRPQDLKLKFYEFAGKVVGKCLYESALGGSYRQLVKAKFTRSFLGQLIGLRINHRYFEQDDPALYLNKIKYILESDVTDMDLCFIDEEMTASGHLKVVELLPNGHVVKVTNTSKMQYVDLIAQHRLVSRVKDEVECFLKGLNDLIPESLLSIFDENELELLLCGTTHFSIMDFKSNHVVCGSSPEFFKVIDWFWTAVSNFSDEEMSRLLQFTTGCSQLPPGGFGDLVPKFQIMASPSFGTLPTAHTCFNEICLPDYASYQDFERSLLLAVNEGSEGFGFF